MKKSVLITGGCGFIGGNLVKALYNKGWVVDVVDHSVEIDPDIFSHDGKNVTRICPAALMPALQKRDREDKILVITSDFTDENILKKISNKKYDIVFHMAAEPRVGFSVKDPVFTTEENLFKTVVLFKACADAGTKVVFSSSSAVYGNADQLPTSEDCKKKPASPYALQKLHAEDYARLFSDLYDLDVVCLRYFNVFGPGALGSSPYATAVAAWCQAIYDGNTLRSDGDGEQTRDLVYVDDIVRINIALGKSAKNFKGDCYNVCTGKSYSNNYVLSRFREKFSNLEIVSAPARIGDVKHTLGDTSKATNDLGFEVVHDFDDALKATWAWWGF